MAARWSRPAGIAFAAVAAVVALFALIVLARPHRRAAGGAGGEPDPATVTVESIELRRQPSARAPVEGVLPRGARVSVVADRGPWIEVRSARDARGFLPADTVEPDSDRDARQKRASKILSFAPVFGVVAEDSDVRLAAFPLAARTGRLPRGTAISIHAVDHAYYAFRAADGSLAFVDSSAVDLVPRDPKQPPIVPVATKELKDVTVTDVAPAEAPTPELSAGGLPAEPAETSDEALEPASLLSKVDPSYPEAARRSGIEGTVVLDALVGPDGQVEDVQILRGLPLGLSESAAEAVRRWHYRPARGRSGPVASHKTVRIVFTLGQ